LSEANLSEANLSEANLSGADLSEADLSGSDLAGANLYKAALGHTKGILSFTGENYTLIYYRYEDQYRVKIGCMDHPIQYWLDNYRKIGQENGFNEDGIELYISQIKFMSKYEIT
jgi:hypothetical protein